MIRINEITYGYGKTTVLDNLSLSVEPGQTVMVTGPNGVGKSTLLRLLAGVLHPDTGSIDYGWENMADPRKRIGFLPDSLSFYRSMTPIQAARFHGKVFGCEPADLTLAGKADIDLHRPVSSLSVGQHVLIQFLIVLSTCPDLILIDEVLHSVDPFLRQILFHHLIGVMEERNPAVIMVNLNYLDVEHLVERVIFLGREGIVLDRLADDLQESGGLSLTESMTAYMKGEYDVRQGDA